jgi:tRNA(fMet)-specific endonuclease VapC
MNYLLDTNICIYIINKHPASVLERIRSKQTDEIAVSTITIAELEYGTERSQYPDQNRIGLLEFLAPVTILDFDQRAATYYGRIRKLLETKGQPIGPMDLLLACQALSQNLILVTNNTKEFKRVEGLRIENWLK